MKGDGEAHPFLSPTDEFASYEIWDKFNLNMSVPKENEHAPVRIRALGAADSGCSSKPSSEPIPTSSA